MLAPDLTLIETLLDLIGDKKLTMGRGGRVTTVPPPKHPFANEILDSLQPFLRHAYFAAAQRKGAKASYPYACPACREWRIQTNDRAKTKCHCGTKQTRYRLEIPWAHANRFNRPTHPKYITTKAETNAQP